MTRARTLLLIDDDPAMHHMVNSILFKSHYRLISAFNGQSGLKKILDCEPDLILLDYMLPDQTGIEVYQEFLSNPAYIAYRTIPVVILTAREQDDITKTRLFASGIQAYLTKPFGLRELKNIIDNVLITHEIHLQNFHLQEEIREMKEYLELLIDNAPIGILSTDVTGSIVKTNPYLNEIMRITNPEQLAGVNLLEQKIFGSIDLRDTFRFVLIDGLKVTLDTFEYLTQNGEWLKLTLTGVPIRSANGQISGLTLLVKDMTDVEKKAYEFSILRQIGVAMQETRDLNELLHLILTSVTAGCALGFSRAMLYSISESDQQLVGKMGVGPGSAEEAGRIWQELAVEDLNLQKFLEKYGKRLPNAQDEFNKRVQNMRLNLNLEGCLITQAVVTKKSIKVTDRLRKHHICSQCHQYLEADEFIVVPLIVQNNVIGILVADNMYNSNRISDNMEQLLVLFANQAAVAIERAEAYQHLEIEKNKLQDAYLELQQVQAQLLQNERLVTMGEMSAHVAHEIRNPLVTIGGFARTLAKSEKIAADEDLALVTQIISDEVLRLERILKNVLDFVKLSRPDFQLHDINQIIQESLIMVKAELTTKNIHLHPELDPSLVPIPLDAAQIKQVLINVLQNAIYSMKQNDDLYLRSFRHENEHILIQIEDTGEGIPQEILKNMFIPFFTTKQDGTGLGLAITQQIINSHGGKIEVESEVGKGTIINISLPITRVKEVS
ncbi:ATP-binding protein [candidate division KSB1 bacterium]|nr:ATP-binding protein [candidate division KSB1 bacterium]